MSIFFQKINDSFHGELQLKLFMVRSDKKILSGQEFKICTDTIDQSLLKLFSRNLHAPKTVFWSLLASHKGQVNCKYPKYLLYFLFLWEKLRAVPPIQFYHCNVKILLLLTRIFFQFYNKSFFHQKCIWINFLL